MKSFISKAAFSHRDRNETNTVSKVVLVVLNFLYCSFIKALFLKLPSTERMCPHNSTSL